MILDCRKFKEIGHITETDIAKDNGFWFSMPLPCHSLCMEP